MSFELTLSPNLPQRNPLTGKFLSGHKAWNKGRPRSEWMSKSGQDKANQQGIENLRKCKHSAASGRPKRKIIGVWPDGDWVPFEHKHIAAKILGIHPSNIGRCYRENAQQRRDIKTGKINTDHEYHGIRWYFDDDEIWMTKIR